MLQRLVAKKSEVETKKAEWAEAEKQAAAKKAAAAAAEQALHDDSESEESGCEGDAGGTVEELD